MVEKLQPLQLRPNNIAFVKVDERPRQDNLSQFVRTNRSSMSSFKEDMDNPFLRNSSTFQKPSSLYNFNQMNGNQIGLMEERMKVVSRGSQLQMENMLQKESEQHQQIFENFTVPGSRGSTKLAPLQGTSSRQSQQKQQQLLLDEVALKQQQQHQNSQYAGSVYNSKLGKLAAIATDNYFLKEEDDIDQNNINNLEVRLEGMREQLELAKYKYEQKNLNALEAQEREMLQKADNLQNVAEEDHEWTNKVRDQLIQLKLRSKDLEEQEKRYEEYIRKIEREAEIDQLVRKKLEMEKMREQQKLIDGMLSRKQREIEGIGQELDKKDIESAGMLQKALRRGEVLQKQLEGGAIDDKTQSLLVDTIIDKNPENEVIRKQILEEIKAKMARDKEDQHYHNQELMQQLNIQRLRFQEAEKVIKEKKQIHQHIMRRGLDFLTEIELGNAPPLEYVVKNIQQNRLEEEEKELQEEEPVQVRETVQRVQENLRVEENRLQQLMDEYARTMNQIQKEEMLYNRDRYQPAAPKIFIPEHKRIIVEPIIEEILNRTFQKISQSEMDAIEVKKNINRLKIQHQSREVRIDQLAGALSMKDLAESFLKIVVEDMARQVAQESIRLNDLAMLKAFELVSKAMKIQKGFKNPDKEMKTIIMTMQGQHMEERKRDIHTIHHSIFTVSGQEIGRLAEIKAQNDVQQEEQKKDKNQKDEDFIDEDADVLDPSECLSFVNSNEVKQIEKDYFLQYVNLEKGQIFGGTLGAKSGGVTAFAISHNKRLVAEAVNNGQILVYNAAANYVLIRKIVTKSTSVYNVLEFSKDNVSQILAVSQEKSVVKSFLMVDKNQLHPLDPNNQSKSLVNQLEERVIVEEQTADLVPHYEVLSDKFLIGDQVKNKKALKEHQIATCAFHSQISQSGFQDYIIIAAKNGTLIRYNSNAPQSAQTNSAGKNQTKEMFANANNNVDFLTGHKVPVIFIQSVDNPTNPLQSPQTIVTIDVAGHIFVWKKPQDKEKFPSKPQKFRIALSYHKFVRLSENRLFPAGKDKEIDPAKKIAPKILTSINNYLQQATLQHDMIAKRAIDKTVKTNNVQIFIVPIQKPPESDEVREFEECIFSADNSLTRRAEVKFKYEEAVSKLGGIKQTKNKRYICIQLIKDHLFSQKDFQTHEFIMFRSENLRLNKYKSSLNIERTAICDFDISDDVQSLGFPYLYFMSNTTIQILSLVSNTVIKTFDFAAEFSKLSKKKVKFDRISVGSYLDIYFNSSSFDATFLYKLENLNSPERHQEFVMFYSKLAEFWK